MSVKNANGGIAVNIVKATVRGVIRLTALIVAYNAAIHRSFELESFRESIGSISTYAIAFAAIGLMYDLVFRVDRTPWRYSSIEQVLQLIRTSSATAVTFLVATFVADRADLLPRSTFVVAWALDIGLMSLLLLTRRAIHERTLRIPLRTLLGEDHYAAGATRLILIGGMDRADWFLRDMMRDEKPKFAPIGLITDQTAVGRELRGVRVIASTKDIDHAVRSFMEEEGDKAILLLDDTVALADLDAELLGNLRAHQVRFLRLPRAVELNDGALRPKVREVDVEELLTRPPVRLDLEETRKLISGRRVLVTGAGGSIGSEICRQISALGCSHISLLDNSEFALFRIDCEIADNHPTLSRMPVICDVTDAARVRHWFELERPEVVFHAAALKHVPLMEMHPDQSVRTNVIGTWNVAEAARDFGVHHMVFISSDKAVNPSSVMGATKRLAESVVQMHNAQASDTQYSVVRFGNVLGSAGSVVPTFKAQIERGGPVTVTHPDIERYFMTIPEAVQLVLHASARAEARGRDSSGVFVLDMGQPVKIVDLARRLIELYGHTPNEDIEIQITGLRPGEKLTEELVDSDEETVDSGPGLIEIIPSKRSSRITKALVQRLDSMSSQSEPHETRALVFKTLADLNKTATAELRSIV